MDLVPGLQPGEVPTSWSADGRSVFVMARGQVPAQVFRVEVSSRQRSPWKTIKAADAGGTDLYLVQALN